MGSAGADIEIVQDRALAVVTLGRASALNALTEAMRAELDQAFARFARDPQVYCAVVQSSSPRAFSAGSDVREYVAAAARDKAHARAMFQGEYALNWRCECFSKPTISLIDGMVMGGGVGISMFGTHRVAGPGFKFAMPETQIGLFPDVGAAWILAAMPDYVGVYLGLTGRSVGPADAYALGLVTHTMPQARFAEIKAHLADADPVDPVLDERHQDPGPGVLTAPLRAVISDCFSAGDVRDIVARLEGIAGEHADWAKETARHLRTRAPLSLAVTLRHFREARGQDLKATLERDYQLACRFLDDHDFYEGVRAALVDKDGKPVWRPARIEDVTQDMVEAYFEPLGDDAYLLPSRQEMQAARA